MRLVLRSEGDDRLLLVISTGFRMVFLAIGVIILAALVSTASTPIFHRANTVPLILCAICFLASLYLERWIFDRKLNLFEKQVGLLFLYGRKKQNLDELSRVLLYQFRKGYAKPPKEEQEREQGPFRRRGLLSRTYITLGVEDSHGKILKLDIAKGAHLTEMRKNGGRIAEFCGIPFMDEADPEPE
jgi:hypothetical protein